MSRWGNPHREYAETLRSEVAMGSNDPFALLAQRRTLYCDRRMSGRRRKKMENQTSEQPQFFATVVAIAVALAPAFIWPGDVPWGEDISFIVAHAIQSNAGHHLAGRGLTGSFPIHYGPLPTQLYQLFLLFTHNLKCLVEIHAAFCGLFEVGALLWLGRTLRLTPWFAAVVMAAPPIVFASRIPWDNTYLIGIGLLAVAAYASFLRGGSGKSLVIALGTAALLPLMHPMALPLGAVIIGHAVWNHRAAISRNWMGLLAVLVVIAGLHSIYFVKTAGEIAELLHKAPPPHPQQAGVVEAAIAPLEAGRLLGTSEAWTDGHTLSRSALILAILGSLGSPIVWLGIGLTTALALGASPARLGWVDPDTAKLRRQMAFISLFSLALQCAYFGVLRCPSFAHYSHGIFPAAALLAWLAIESLRRFRIACPLLAVWGLSALAYSVGEIRAAHRDMYAPGEVATLNDLIAVDQVVKQYDSPRLYMAAPLAPAFTNARRCIRIAYPASDAPSRIAKFGLIVQLLPAVDEHGNRVSVSEALSPSDIPANAKEIDLSPMLK